MDNNTTTIILVYDPWRTVAWTLPWTNNTTTGTLPLAVFQDEPSASEGTTLRFSLPPIELPAKKRRTRAPRPWREDVDPRFEPAPVGPAWQVSLRAFSGR